ncbi:MAG: hypothetical protein ACYTFN_08815 [Planctomycetota bacterium]
MPQLEGITSRSTVRSMPILTAASISSGAAPNPARRSRCAAFLWSHGSVLVGFQIDRSWATFAAEDDRALPPPTVPLLLRTLRLARPVRILARLRTLRDCTRSPGMDGFPCLLMVFLFGDSS